jgi:hypothetical protein
VYDKSVVVPADGLVQAGESRPRLAPGQFLVARVSVTRRPSSSGTSVPGEVQLAGLSACGSGRVGGDHISSVPVQGGPGPVVAHRRARVGVRGGFLHIPQRHACVKRGGDECVSQRVWPHGLGDPGAAGEQADDPGGTVPVQPSPVAGEEDRPLAPLPDRKIDRAGGSAAPAGS